MTSKNECAENDLRCECGLNWTPARIQKVDGTPDDYVRCVNCKKAHHRPIADVKGISDNPRFNSTGGQISEISCKHIPVFKGISAETVEQCAYCSPPEVCTHPPYMQPEKPRMTKARLRQLTEEEPDDVDCEVGNPIDAAITALLASGDVVLRGELDAAHHLLNHIHREVAALEDFDAASLMEEIEQTLNGTKIFDDNKFLNEQLVVLRGDVEELVATGEMAVTRMKEFPGLNCDTEEVIIWLNILKDSGQALQKALTKFTTK